MINADVGGGSVNELPCSFLMGVIKLQEVCGAIQCMNMGVYIHCLTLAYACFYPPWIGA